MATYSNSRAAATPKLPSRTPISRTRARAVSCLRSTATRRVLVLARAESKPAEKPQSAVAAGRVELAVAPWGEVLVAGKSRGISPPLRVLELAPGTHTVEIRTSTFPAHVARVEVKAGEAVRIQYRVR